MPRKFTDALINDAIERLSEGKMLKTVAEELRVSPNNLSIYVRKRGFIIPQHRRTEDRLDLPQEEIISMYQSGVSILGIAHRFGCARNAIQRRLERAGVPIRNQSEANTMRLSKATPEYRQALTKAAHDAVRGVRFSHEAMCRRAIKREHSGFSSHFGPGENEICNALTAHKIHFVRQKAVDIYNVDIAVGHVAVEVTCGTVKYRGGNTAENKRIKKLLECGYSPIMVEFSDVFTISAYLDKIVSTINEACGLPPFEREYWVIRCYSKDYTIFRNELGQFASIKTPKELFCERKTVNL